MIIKKANNNITSDCIKSTATDQDDPEILHYFKKTAADLKAIAPRAKDFLYFTTIMMHAAEASALDDNGEIKKTAKGEPVSVGWDVLDNGAWVWKSNDPNVRPYKNNNCFIPGTKILMEDGSVKNIEDVSVGDKVVTHKNRVRKVVNTFVHDVDEDIFNIKISRNRSISCTKEHPFLTIDFDKKDSNVYRNLASKKYSYSFKEANSVNKGDFLFAPVLKETSELNISENKARLLGLYAAEGSLFKRNGVIKGVIFTFGAHEYDNLAKECVDLLKSEYPTTNVKSKKIGSKTSVVISNQEFANLCKDHVGEYSLEKKLSKDIVFSNNNIKKPFLIGWLEGDGHIDKHSGKVVGTTVSANMASQVRVMLNSLKVNNCIYEEKPSISHIDGRKISGQNVFRIKFPYNEGVDLLKGSNKLSFEKVKNIKKVKMNHYNEDYSIHRVLSKNSMPYKGKVYNFEVEDDHSYVANDIVCHNCDIFPEAELIKAHKNWVGKPLCLDHQSQSVDHVRGIIVDTVYDHKGKRIIALCAIDKINYPDLARKVASGYATSVSMGTAVERAICTEAGCHAVARYEHEFCTHMKTKSCYGEINVGLNPIELSIVVNPADPRAKIRRVIASSNALAEYIDKKADTEEDYSEEEVNKLKSEVEELSEELDKIKEEAKCLEEEISEMKDEADKDISKEDDKNEESEEKKDEMEASDGDNLSLNKESDIKWTHGLNNKVVLLQEKLSYINNYISKIGLQKGHNEEQNMTKKEAYFLGGGGVNEPTPKQAKYPKEDADSIRNQDKQMVGQMNTGPVDGMHPGYESFGESEEARKKRLQRMAAEKEQRKLRREAAVQLAKEALAKRKEAYFLGGGGVNEPTPGKPKYEKEDSDSIRNTKDKQMVGAAPFPNTGPVDGLFPGDLEKKEKVSRAENLSGRFVKASKADGSDDLGASRWDIYVKQAGSDKRSLVLSATVAELAGDKVQALYPAIATEEYGKKIISTIRTAGLEAAKGIFKGAQTVPVIPAGPVAQEELAQKAAPVEFEEKVEDVDYSGETGESSDQLKDLVHELGNLHSDLEKAVDALEEEGAADTVELPMATASVSVEDIGKTLKVALLKEMKKSIASIEEVVDELKLIKEVGGSKLDNKTASVFSKVVKDSISDAKEAKERAYRNLASFVRYAKGVEALKKKAQISPLDVAHSVAEDASFANSTEADWVIDRGTGEFEPLNKGEFLLLKSGKPLPAGWEVKSVSDSAFADDKKSVGEKVVQDVEGESGYKGDREKHQEQDKANEAKDTKKYNKPDYKKEKLVDFGNAYDENDLKMNEDGSVEGSAKDIAEVLKSASKEERAALRIALAQKGVQFSDVLKAHKGGVKTKLDVKVTGDLDKVETLEEQHAKMLEVAEQKVPSKVRLAAEKIETLVKAGEINPNKDFPGLIAEGLDAAAVAYWKKYFAEAKDPASTQFVSDLVKDFNKKKASASEDAGKVKIARAYEAAYSMAERGIIGRDPASLRQQAEKLLSYSDENFEHFTSTLSRIQPKKASTVEVGVHDSVLDSIEVPSGKSENLTELFSSAFSGRKY
jgi:intein/homing endonuclease